MSHEAVAWAIEQTTGSPGAKLVLWSVSGYANEFWVCWPSQQLIAKQSEQSVDAVQKREKDLVARGLLRRIRMRRHGRRTIDFLILAPSPLFTSSIADLWSYLPAGCEPMDDDAAAFPGSVESPDNDAAAFHGSAENTDDATANPGSATLPHLSAHATALERQLVEPATEPRKEPIPKPLSEDGKGISESPDSKKSEEVAPPPAQPDPAFEADWETFRRDYPDGILDLSRAERALRALSPEDRKKAVAALPVLAQRCKRRAEKAPKAHIYLDRRSFDGLLSGAAVASSRTFCPLGSREARAVRTIWRLHGNDPPVSKGLSNQPGYWIGFALSAQLMALADAPERGSWVEIDPHSSAARAPCGAWRDILKATIERGLGINRNGLVSVPRLWPPRADGSWPEADSTGPPWVESPEEAAEEFARLNA